MMAELHAGAKRRRREAVEARMAEMSPGANLKTRRAKLKPAAVNTLDGMLFMKYGPTLLLTTPVMDRFKMTIDPATGEFK